MQFFQLFLRADLRDAQGEQLAQKAGAQLGIDTPPLRCAKVFAVASSLYECLPAENRAESLRNFAEDCLRDAIADEVLCGELRPLSPAGCAIAVAAQAGVTDDEGRSVQEAFIDYFDLSSKVDGDAQAVFSQSLYYLPQQLNEGDLRQFAHRLLGNPLINHFQYFSGDELAIERLFVPQVRLSANAEIATFELANADDAELMRLSRENVWALDLEEMRAIKAHYAAPATQAARAALGLSAAPTDCELEILAQTWSEHCKHKEFNAVIEYYDPKTGKTETVRSLFKSYIRAATETVREQLLKKGNDWLIKIFTDNAGVVRINKDWLFVWKVETHNSPSALDPYGGAITGILGNNRDPLCTGVGGAKLLFNTNVLCFGFPDTPSDRLLKNQLPPRQILQGVVAGVRDGGNKSGVPTVNGAIVFDERFGGKPLVYCGTGGVMPHHYKGKNSWEKPIAAGDKIIMLGGRVGKDGIHGATFSSLEIDEHSPMSAVQIGSPITQKKAADFLIRAANEGLIKCSTDNGAGGLSSSIGELATISGGAEVWLERVPLKYAGLRPWEIFVSESQERMTLVVEPAQWAALQELAHLFAVELSDIGIFTDTGRLDVRWAGEAVAVLDMEFLHEGTPQKYLKAIVPTPDLEAAQLPENLDYNAILLELLAAWNVCSREQIIRRYDHEVKGKTILKPLMGSKGKAPQDAAVVRLHFDTYEGIAVSNGILPRYGDIDAYEMSAGAFDEAMRQIIAVGGSLPNQQENDDIFWSVNDNFCVPDSVYDPITNPDGKEKLAKLVQMCRALYDMSTFFDIPLTSGKDSMKNDFKSEGTKISVPPTILYSMTAKMPDIRRVVTSEFKQAGDAIYQIGRSYEELGASEFYALFGQLGEHVPLVRKEAAKARYLRMMQAHGLGLFASVHDLSDGGLAVALAESCFGGSVGATINLPNSLFADNLSLEAALFGESHSRFLVSVRAERAGELEAIFGADAFYLGKVGGENLHIGKEDVELVGQPVERLLEAWQSREF